MDTSALVRRYYDALDGHEYDALESLLAREFVQRRPDRTFENRRAFVEFVREERPMTDTTHELVDVIADGDQAAVSGRLLDSADELLFEFADLFTTSNGRIDRLETYTR